MKTLALVALGLIACSKPQPARDAAPAVAPAAPAPDGAVMPALAKAPPAAALSTVSVTNAAAKDEVVYVAFGADSVVLPTAWTFCPPASKLNCSFKLKAGATQALPLSGYLNATLSFGAPVTCGQTKAELNVNNPKWYDIADVSLVDGYSNKVVIEVTSAGTTTKLGPPLGAKGNEKVFGLFPLGCDICTARQSPPCGMKPGRDGCKAGTQYRPDVPCQYQGKVMGGGSVVKVTHLK